LWISPVLAAAAVVVVAVGLLMAVRLARADRPALEAGPSLHATSAPAHPSSSTGPDTSAGSSGPGRSVPQNWFASVDIAALPHPELGCPSGLNPAVTVSQRTTVPVGSESGPLGVAVISCGGPTGEWPDRVAVFRYAPSGPQLLQLLPQPSARGVIVVNKLSTGQNTIEVSAAGHSATAPAAQPDLPYQQQFSWQVLPGGSGRFVAGPVLDRTAPCTGSALSVSTQQLSTPSGEGRGLLVVYRNTAAAACSLTGYPGAAAVDVAQKTLADAERTATGALGGLASATDGVPIVTLPPGQSASAVIEWSVPSGSGPSCVSAADLLSTPPNTTATGSLGVSGVICGLRVHPVVSGRSGKP
jgi:hypothetical protein